MFNSLLKAGVTVPCDDSPVHTRFSSLQKTQIMGNKIELCEELHTVNAAVQPRAPDVPNPSTKSSEVPQNAADFSMLDLANAFFSVHVPNGEGKKVSRGKWC